MLATETRYWRAIGSAPARSQGRYKACLFYKDSYLLHGHRYNGLNLVRADMVADPADYEWTSYRRNAFGQSNPVTSPHPM